ncbi:50S ribosomal protein L25/general stress protein Ctc [Shumkonia mesophila]|uniref:50S ribosomal protein L25/general stress protein Ctc n=1 Tax=Shumkonia mesophila TaxID=2838854 RepID=UPI0029341220|nr:50S ribosomal protein L25/general stress protein Ctc [Shumkonia mesophila]
MAKHTVLAAELRERAGKGAARATRRAGRIPAVLYGNKLEPKMVSLDPVQLNIEINKAGFFGRVFEIDLGKEKFAVLPRDVQYHPLTDRPIHLDFLRFSAETKVHVEVAVDFQNETASPGLKRGGVLNVVRRDVELVCSPESIPESIVVDLTGLDIGDSIHISHVKLPEGVEPAITDRDFTIATIASPSVEVVEKAEGAEEELAAPTAEPAATSEE